MGGEHIFYQPLSPTPISSSFIFLPPFFCLPFSIEKALLAMRSLIVLSLSASVHLSLASTSGCYFPNGNASSSDWSACVASDSNSACCHVSDLCLSNGYCFSQAASSASGTFANRLYRGGCTDKSWRDSSCPQYCADSKYMRAFSRFSQYARSGRRLREARSQYGRSTNYRAGRGRSQRLLLLRVREQLLLWRQMPDRFQWRQPTL